jgi:transcriptional regulator GlxA family with amidase domain
MAAKGSRQILFIAFDQVLLLDLSGPLQVFDTSCELADGRQSPYRVRLASAHGGLVTTSSGVQVMTEPLAGVRGKEIDTVVVPGGPGVHAAAKDKKLVQWLRVNAPRIRRVCGACTGAFVLGAAGLLQGRRAVTHWGSCDLLQQNFPAASVTPDALFVHDAGVWTSAGVTAGIDLALTLVEADRGHREAMRVARRLVVFLKRPGGQAQFSVPLSLQAGEDSGFEQLHGWMQDNLTLDLKVETLAEHMGMSARTFARKYVEAVGRTPASVVEELRVEAARQALENTDLSLKQIAARCGFGDEDRMRRAFRRRLSVTPQDYRSRFANEPASIAPVVDMSVAAMPRGGR